MMSIHLGLHWSIVVGNLKANNKIIILAIRTIVIIVSVYGAYLFGSNGIYSYIFMKTPFATLDYDKFSVIVLLENLIMMISWVCIGYYLNKSFIKRKYLPYIINNTDRCTNRHTKKCKYTTIIRSR